MGNIAKKHHSKSDPDTKRNDGALGFFQRASPPNNNNYNNNNKKNISWSKNYFTKGSMKKLFVCPKTVYRTIRKQGASGGKSQGTRLLKFLNTV